MVGRNLLPSRPSTPMAYRSSQWIRCVLNVSAEKRMSISGVGRNGIPKSASLFPTTSIFAGATGVSPSGERYKCVLLSTTASSPPILMTLSCSTYHPALPSFPTRSLTLDNRLVHSTASPTRSSFLKSNVPPTHIRSSPPGGWRGVLSVPSERREEVGTLEGWKRIRDQA